MNSVPVSASQQPSYAIVLVTYNRKERLKVVLEHLNAQTIQPIRLVIIDNHSTDGTGDFLRSIDMRFPFKVITAADNGGHGAGLALGMKAVLEIPDISYVLLLEDDSFPAPELSAFLLHTALAVNADILCLDGFVLSTGKRRRPQFKDHRPMPVDFALLDGALIHLDVIRKTGLPRSDFFMMCDDLEFSLRIKKAGYQIFCVKTDLHHILHLGGERGFTRTMLWRGYYQARNGLHILKDHFSFYGLADYVLLEGKRILGCLPANDRFYRISLRLLGVWHGLTGKFGKTLDPKDF